MLRPSERAPGLLVGDGVDLPEDAVLGGNVVIHDGSVLGARLRLGDNCVIGKPTTLSARSTAPGGDPGAASLGDGVAVGAGAVVLAGARIADPPCRNFSGVMTPSLLNTRPSFITKLTVRSVSRSSRGFPATAIMSAGNPTLIGPRRVSRPLTS